MLRQYWGKIKWLISGPPKQIPKSPHKGPFSNVFPLAVPLAPDEEKGWKPYPIFKRNLEGKYKLSAHASVLVPGYSPHPPHIHKEEEILIMLAGEADILGPEDQQRTMVRAGDFAFFPSGHAHSLEATGEMPANYLMFKWSGHPINKGKNLEYILYQDFISFQDNFSEQRLSLKRLFEGTTSCLYKFHCHLSYLPPGKGYPAHKDPYDVAIVMIEGEVKTLNTTARPFDVIFYAAGEPHGMTNPGITASRYLVFEFHFQFVTAIKT